MSNDGTERAPSGAQKPAPADELEALLGVLPPHISDPLWALSERAELLEVILDLGREPEARLPGREVLLSSHPVTGEDIEHVIQRIGAFGEDNRAGIARTLHRISAIRNRSGRIIGLTCRAGRAVFGTLALLRDIIESGHSVLMMGRPGVGKTTMLREAARVLADELKKRVVIVDTSNEIAGDGDIPHPAIGRARRMQVPAPHLQHAVMIEAVENHMPEVIVIDEIGTEREAQAARTIAERGVQLIGTAHGNTLFNLLLNPTLSDLVGGIQAVTLSDEEARRRGTQKTVLERKAPPTFDQLVEIQSHSRLKVHENVTETVDALLRGRPAFSTLRCRDEQGEIRIEKSRLSPPTLGPLRETASFPGRRESEGEPGPTPIPAFGPAMRPLHLYPFGVNKALLVHTLRALRLPARLVDSLEEAEVLLTVRSSHRRRPRTIRRAQEMDLPIHVLESNTRGAIEEGLLQLFRQSLQDHPVGLG